MWVPMGRPKLLASVMRTSIAFTEMLVWLAVFTGPDCSFKTTEPRPARVMVVLGAGVAEMLLPATIRLTKVVPPVLDAWVAVAWLNASAVTRSAEIKPARIVADWTVELAGTSAVVAV